MSLKNKNIIITGGGGSGKTTLINALANAGYSTMPEVSRQIIKEQQQVNGHKVPWLDLNGFGELCLHRMEEQLTLNQDQICFYDRGIPDIHAYFTCNNLPIDSMYYREVDRYHSTVFICPPWKDIFINDPQRPESFDYSAKIYHCLKNVYQQLGFNIKELPKVSVEGRLDFVEMNLVQVAKFNPVLNTNPTF